MRYMYTKPHEPVLKEVVCLNPCGGCAIGQLTVPVPQGQAGSEPELLMDASPSQWASLCGAAQQVIDDHTAIDMIYRADMDPTDHRAIANLVEVNLDEDSPLKVNCAALLAAQQAIVRIARNDCPNYGYPYHPEY